MDIAEVQTKYVPDITLIKATHFLHKIQLAS